MFSVLFWLQDPSAKGDAVTLRIIDEAVGSIATRRPIQAVFVDACPIDCLDVIRKELGAEASVFDMPGMLELCQHLQACHSDAFKYVCICGCEKLKFF